MSLANGVVCGAYERFRMSPTVSRKSGPRLAHLCVTTTESAPFVAVFDGSSCSKGEPALEGLVGPYIFWGSGRKLDSIFLLECNAASILSKHTKAENSPV